MKRYIFIIVALLSMMGVKAQFAWDVQVDDLRYDLYEDHHAALRSAVYDNISEGDVITVPSTVTYEDVTYTVTGVNGWDSGNKVVSLVLPETITADLVLSNFGSEVATLTLPAALSSLKVYGNVNVKEFAFGSENPYFTVEDGVLFNKDKTTLLCYPRFKTGVKYELPTEVRNIGEHAFDYNPRLETVVLPDGLLTIGDYAFCNVTTLNECNFPRTLSSIGNSAFYNCRIVLEDNTFVLPPNLQSIGENAFNGAFRNYGNVSVVFPSSLGQSGSQLTVGYYAFSCNSIDSKMTDPVHSNESAFGNVSTIYIPYNTKAIYEAKTGWNRDVNKLHESSNPDAETVAKVEITRVLDFENNTVKVRFATETEGAVIRYKKVENDANENSDPATWDLYTPGDVIDVTSSEWPYYSNTYYIKAIATKEGLNNSPIATMAIYYPELRTGTPTIDCVAGSKTLTMSSADEKVRIYYTTDGSTPNSNSTEYTGQITLDGNYTYKAIAYKEGYFPSDVVTKDVTWFRCQSPKITYEAVSAAGDEVLISVTALGEGESLMYRTDNFSDFIPYTGPVKETVNRYFYAYAIKDNYNNSEQVSIYTYLSTVQCQKPYINVNQDTKELTLTAQEGEKIYFTLNGDEPKVEPALEYTEPITLSGNCTIRAIAYKAGKFQSEIAQITIDNWFEMSPVTMEQVVENGQPMMKLVCATEGATIVYSFNWYYEDYTYNAPFAVAEGQTVYVKAKKSGFVDSEWRQLQIDYSQYERCESPSWEYNNETHQVTLTTKEDGADIYFVIDTDGNQNPTTASTKYTGPFVPGANGTLKWVAAKESKINSPVSSSTLEDVLRLHDVSFIPVIGESEGQYKLKFEYKDQVFNSGVDIYYWYDGIGETKYEGEAIDVPVSTYVYAQARKEGYPYSNANSYYVAHDYYVVQQPNVQGDSDAKKVKVSCGTEGVTFYYTVDGTDPTVESATKLEDWQKGELTAEYNCTYKFIAVKEGMINSPVTEYAVNWFRVPPVKFTAYADVHTQKMMMKLEVDVDANEVWKYDKIYWEYEGSRIENAVEENRLYEGPFELEEGRSIYASAYKENFNSNWSYRNGIYRSELTCSSPEISVSSDTVLHIIPRTEGDKIRYTLDGSEPSLYVGNEYTEAFKLEKNAEIKAVAFRDDKLTSSVSSRNFELYQVKPVKITPYAENNKFMVKMETETPNAVIWYTLGDPKSKITDNTRYNGPFEISDGTRISASAAFDGYRDAEWASTDWNYSNNYRCGTPTISVTDTVVTITGSENAKIYYTLDGSEPTVNSTEYRAPFKLTKNATIKAIAAADGFLNSSVYETSFSDYKVKSVVFTPYAEYGKLMVAIACEDADAKIYYKVGEGYNTEDITAEPNQAYYGPFEIKDGQRVFASAAKDGYRNADWRNSDNIWKYQVTANQPNVNIDVDATVTITVIGEKNAKIYYTTDGTEPNQYSSTEYKEPFVLERNGEVRAISVVDKKFNSNYASARYDNFRVSEVIFTPVVENNELKMKLSSETPGVTFYYGINDYPPSSGLSTKYTGPFVIPDGCYLYANGTKDGFNETGWLYRDNISYSNYRTNTPLISIADTLVTITGVEDAKLYYTLDGSDPTVNSTQYEEPFKLSRNSTVKAIALVDGMLPSNTRERTYSDFHLNPVKFSSFAQGENMMVELGCQDEGASIYYSITDDYNNEDITAEPNIKYTAPFVVPDNQRVWAIAVKDGFNTSGWYETTFNKKDLNSRIPRISINSEAMVTITVTGETNPVIYYTIDGTDPTIGSTKYEAPFKLDVNSEVRAIAQGEKKFISGINSNRYDGYRVAPVTITPFVENNVVKVKMETTTEGATIYYGINEQPGVATAGMTYTAPFEVSDATFIYASAVKPGYNDAEWSSHDGIYINSYRCGQPSITVTGTTVTMGGLEGASIYYTLDGSEPTASSTLYSKAFTLTKNATIKAIATMSGRLNSTVAERTYSDFRVKNVNFNMYAQNNNLMMELSCEDKDATIYYKVGDGYNANDITASPNVKYTAPFAVQEGRRVWASAAKDGFNNAAWVVKDDINRGAYTAGMPDISADDNANVVITGEKDATFYYTTDGKTPTTSSTKYNASFKLAQNDTVKAIAVVDGKFNSDVCQYIYSGYSVEPVAITPFVEDNAVKVRLTTTTPNTTIYYGINDRNEKASANIRYSAPFVIKNGDRIFASAVRSGYKDAKWSQTTEIYLSVYTCSAPIISVDGEGNVSIGSDAGATIYYTTDNSNPTTSSTVYTGSFILTKNTTIKAFATKTGMINSDVRELTFNDFRVANPVFAQDGTKMTITTTTPDATIYYAYGSEGGDVNTGAHKYDGTFEMKDNSRIVAMAVRDGWHNSEVMEIYPEKLVACPLVEKVSYDGHFLTLKTIDGATIWYTTNGNTPEDNTNQTVNWVYEYRSPIAVNGTGQIKAIATKNYLNQSEVATFDINFYAGENGTKLESSGVLEEVMSWSDPTTIKEFNIEGPLNQEDLKYIKENMTALEILDMSNTTIDDGVLPDYAFSGLPIVSFTSPANVTAVGKGIFTNCPELAAVVWNSLAKLPDNSFDTDKNPNLLLYLLNESAAPSRSVIDNLIINGTAQTITLVDADNINFHCPQQFYARNINYTHKFTMTTGDGGGWEAIALPFTAAKFTHESKGELLPFTTWEEKERPEEFKPFWLRELSETGFVDATVMEANKPYIVSMPNNSSYATRFRLAGNVSFSATDVYVPVTEPQSVVKYDVTMTANFRHKDKMDGIWALNVEADESHLPGSAFLNDLRPVRAFEAYATSKNGSRRAIVIDEDPGVTAIRDIELLGSDVANGTVKVYDLSGHLVATGILDDVMKRLPKGVYLINGRKAVVK